MFDFHWPWMAIVLALPLAARYYWLRHPDEDDRQQEGQRTTLLHPDLARLTRAFHGNKPGRPLASRIYPWLLWFTWIALVAALMAAAEEAGTALQPVAYDATASDASLAYAAGCVPRIACLGHVRENSHGFEVARLAVFERLLETLVAAIRLRLPGLSDWR